MYNISFHTTWDETDSEFLDSITRQTPNESGEWGQVHGTSDLDRADYHVVFNSPREDFDSSKTILFSAEPPFSSLYHGWDTVETAGKFPIESYHKPQRWWVKKTYDELIDLNRLTKSRELSWVTTDKGKEVSGINKLFRKAVRRIGWNEVDRRGFPVVGTGPADGHVSRMSFYKRLISEHSEVLDLYGRGQFSGPHYHGEIKDKWTGLGEYRYTLAIENYKGPNYFSEKISDALLAWCMPIYWGCTNLPEFLPQNSYVWIDIEDSSAPDKVREIVESDLREENLDAIKEARRRILNRYQIWPTVESVVDEL